MLFPVEMSSSGSAKAFLFCAVTPVIHTHLVCCKLTLSATRSAKVSATKIKISRAGGAGQNKQLIE